MFKFNKEELLKNIKRLENASVLVVGDLAIDEMIYGDTERISREAPVLILAYDHTKIILGGASNAAHNISTLNAGKVAVIGLCGDDYYANVLKKAFSDANVDTQYIVADATRHTTVKTRISGACSHSVRQQIVRIDRQTKKYVADVIEQKLIENIKKAVPKFDAVILSDYNIGTLSENIIKETIKCAKENNKIVVVDAQKELAKYQGVTALTPNQPDTEKEVGYFIKDTQTLKNAAKDLLEKTNADNVLITRGSEGMAICNKDGIYEIPVFNKSHVFDVTGAGDTVVASFTLALASGASVEYASIIGNLAASLVVRKYGCATTTIEELSESAKSLEF